MWKSKIENRNLNWFESFKFKLEKKMEKKKIENSTLGQIQLGPAPIRPRDPLPLNPSNPRHPSTDAWGSSASPLHPRSRMSIATAR